MPAVRSPTEAMHQYSTPWTNPCAEAKLQSGGIGNVASGRPQVSVKSARGQSMLTLIDTGASKSLIRRDVAVNVLNGLGRPAVFQKCKEVLTSVTGHGLEVVGKIELLIQPVGLVSFLVVSAMSQECIVGMDQLKRHGYCVTDTPVGKFTWGRAEYLLDEKPWIDSGISEVTDHPVRKVIRSTGTCSLRREL